MNLSRQLHPTIYQKLDELERRMMRDLTLRGDEGARRREVLKRHQAIWNRTYGKAFLRQVGVTLGLMVGAAAWAASSPDVVADLALLGSSAATVFASWRFIVKNRRSVTGEELHNLLGLVSLDPTESLYCEAMVALAQMNQIPEHESTTIAAQLNHLLDVSLHLEERRRLLEDATREPVEALVDELKALEARQAAATDPQTRDALSRTAGLCRDRLESRVELEADQARLAAHAELVAQSFKRLRESLSRLKLARAALREPDLKGALDAIADVTAITTAYEAGPEARAGEPVSSAVSAPVPVRG